MTALATIYLNEFAAVNDFPFDLGSPKGINYLSRVWQAVAAELRKLDTTGVTEENAFAFFEANADALIEAACAEPFTI